MIYRLTSSLEVTPLLGSIPRVGLRGKDILYPLLCILIVRLLFCVESLNKFAAVSKVMFRFLGIFAFRVSFLFNEVLLTLLL